MKNKKRNPQDTTLRNINALKKRVSKLETKLKSISLHIIMLMDSIFIDLKSKEKRNGRRK